MFPETVPCVSNPVYSSHFVPYSFQNEYQHLYNKITPYLPFFWKFSLDTCRFSKFHSFRLEFVFRKTNPVMQSDVTRSDAKHSKMQSRKRNTLTCKGQGRSHSSISHLCEAIKIKRTTKIYHTIAPLFFCQADFLDIATKHGYNPSL